MKPRGTILAGGSGARLHPTTQAVNNQLLPEPHKPMDRQEGQLRVEQMGGGMTCLDTGTCDSPQELCGCWSGTGERSLRWNDPHVAITRPLDQAVAAGKVFA